MRLGFIGSIVKLGPALYKHIENINNTGGGWDK